MKSTRKEKRKAKRFKRAVRLTFESLTSHISWSVGKKTKGKDGTKQFHRKTIREYAEIILELCKLYERSK